MFTPQKHCIHYNVELVYKWCGRNQAGKKKTQPKILTRTDVTINGKWYIFNH